MAPTILRSRTLRYTVPVAVVAAVGISFGVSSVVAGAAPALPERTAAQLLADIADAPSQPFSGTVVETAKLGLPELPSTGATGSGASLTSLLTGSNTARVWYGSTDQVRIALVGDLTETDVIRNGRDVWLWSSAENTATHAELPAGTTGGDWNPETLPVDPQQAAEQALAAVDPSTEVTVDGTSTIAGRDAYELVLTPRAGGSLVGEVRLGIDAETSVPLRVQVYAKGSAEPAFETGFTAVQFEAPDPSVFTFTPPAGAEVTEADLPTMTTDGAYDKARDEVRGLRAAGDGGPSVIGKGWESILVLDDITLGSGAQGGAALDALLQSTTPVSGSYGSGQLLTTSLASILLLDDGRLLIGAVTPAVLEQAASTLG